MKNYNDFLGRWSEFAKERSILWAVIGSHAMMAHAKMAGIPPRREAHDLDMIVFLPRVFDVEFREWIDRRSMWVYERWGLGAIHLWCDCGSQIDLFVKPDTAEIGRAVIGEVLAGNYPLVSKDDLLTALDRWAEDTKNPGHVKHNDQKKYQEDAAWVRRYITS